MSELVLQPVDPFDRPAVDEFHDVYLAAELAHGPGIGSPFMREEYRALLQQRATSRWIGGYVGLVAGRAVVSGLLRTPLLDNLTSGDVTVHVRPDRWRRGLGSAMLHELERQALERGRTLVNGEAVWSHEAGPDGAGQAGPEFLRHHGYVLGLTDVKRTLDLPVDEALLDELAAEAARCHPTYTLRSWVGPVPDELLTGWARLVSSLVTEAPTGEVEREPESADPAVVREHEAIAAAQGRAKYNTVALDAAGEVVAYTDLVTTVHHPELAYQWGTLVRRDARGHRLGLAVKVANQRLLQQECPDAEVVATYNAEVNAHMVGVNERLGFRPVARLGEFQKRLVVRTSTSRRPSRA